MKKHAAFRVVAVLVMFANAIAWALVDGSGTGGAFVRHETVGTWALIWGISAVLSFVLVLVHACTHRLGRDFLALFDVVELSRHEALRRKHEALRQRHGSLVKTHRALAKDHRALRADYDHMVYQRNFVNGLNEEPADKSPSALEPASAQ